MDRKWTRAGGWWAVAAGITGVAGALFLLLVPPAVSPGVTNYPVSEAVYPVVQTVFSLHHFAMAVALWFFHRAGLAGSGAFASRSVKAAVIVMFFFGLWELVAVSDDGQRQDSEAFAWVGAGYGLLTVASGVTVILWGVAVIRARVLNGPARFVPLIVGVYVFMPMLPLLFLSFESGRLVIGGWLFLFGVLGAAMLGAGSDRNPAAPISLGGERRAL